MLSDISRAHYLYFKYYKKEYQIHISIQILKINQTFGAEIGLTLKYVAKKQHKCIFIR